MRSGPKPQTVLECFTRKSVKILGLVTWKAIVTLARKMWMAF